MGSPKALLRYREETFLDTLTALFATRCSPVIVVLGARAAEIRAGALRSATFVVNPDYARGMTTSLQCGLRAVPPDADGVLFTLVDHPAASPATLDALLTGIWGAGMLAGRVETPASGGRPGYSTAMENDGSPSHASGTPLPDGVPSGPGPVRSLRIEPGLEGAQTRAHPEFHDIGSSETLLDPLRDRASEECGLAPARPDRAPLLRVPRYRGKRGHPIWFASQLILEFRALPAEGAAREVVRRHVARTEFLDLDDPGIVADIDSPEDYRALPGAGK
jgi:CTP:molybdopterin cytidylyltransferase MocA